METRESVNRESRIVHRSAFASFVCSVGIIIFCAALFIFGCCETHGAPGGRALPSPTPFSISDEELSKLSWDDIIKTAIHQGELFQEEHAIRLDLQKNLDDATQRITAIVDAATGGLAHTTTLQQGITVLADHDAKETERANKLDKALWWYRLHWWGAWIMLGLGVLACAVFAFLKFSGRVAITGAKVAAAI
jgi:hypothetical protein